MVACLTTERERLVQTVRKKRLSISLLAEELGRSRGAVSERFEEAGDGSVGDLGVFDWAVFDAAVVADKLVALVEP